MRSKRIRCKVQHFARGDKKPTTLIEDLSLTRARKYARDWVHCHSTNTYPFKKDRDCDRYQSKFSAIYIEEYKI
jgi:hypothetical protein